MHTTPELREGSLLPMVVTVAEGPPHAHYTGASRRKPPISALGEPPPHSLPLWKRVVETRLEGDAGGTTGIEIGFFGLHRQSDARRSDGHSRCQTARPSQSSVGGAAGRGREREVEVRT